MGHPAQYLFIRNVILNIKKGKEIEFKLLLKTKDVLVSLVQEDGVEYENIYDKVRGDSKFSIIWSLFIRILRVMKFTIKFNPDLFWGGDPSIAIVSKIFRKDCIIVGEDDYSVIYKLARITYPFATVIVCPDVCDVGPYNYKKIGYNGYMKLAYLHPDVFVYDKNISLKYTGSHNYVLIRLSDLKAYHDEGIGGFNDAILDDVIELLKKFDYNIFISSEGKMPDKYSKYLIKPKPMEMVHVLAGSSMFIGDSQSMTVEAAMLGVPSVRFSDFAGRISVLEELENRYRLTFGISSKSSDQFLEKIHGLLLMSDLKLEFMKRREVMLKEKINVTNFIDSVLKKYPSSIKLNASKC